MLSDKDIKDLQYVRECMKKGLVNIPLIDRILEKVEMNESSPSRKPLTKREKRVAHYMAKIKV